VVLQTDISAIIQTERQERGKLLDDQARIIRATLDHINQGVAIFDANGDLVGWNQRLGDLLAIPLARMLKGASFETLFQRFRAGFSLADMDEARLVAWVDGRAGRAALSFEIRRGSVTLAVFAQEMPEGGFVMSFTDVSAERQAIEGLSAANETLEARVRGRTLQLEDALADAERANASRSRFVAAASHDLLQPLSAAKLFMASIGDEAITSAARGALDKAQNALMSVEGILGSLLDISKLESGKVAVQVGPVRMGALLRQLQDEFAGFAQAKGLRLVVHPCDYVVESDPGYLRRILQNLIGNAIRYTDQGRVMVGARKRGGMLRLEVWDTGPGIPEAEQDNIFKEFHRLNARASASEGMGLGLAIVERACALLGHPLELRSKMGRGSGFMVQVPILNIASQSEVLAVQSEPTPMQDRIVFLVENDEDLRRAMGLLLEKWGVHVLEAASGEEALALIEDLGILPDLALVDHQLGSGMTGLEFIAELTRQYGPLPLRLVTAERSEVLIQACAARGVSILHKPIDAMSLREVIADLSPTTKAP
jgi:signal transduction histidine kinase